MKQSICELVRQAEEDYTSGPVKKGKYVEYDMYEIINTIDAYSNSQHITGKYDSLGREKPFFNIVTAAINIWYRGTDIDRKDIRILPDKSKNLVLAFVANVLLKQWMIKERFGVFLNLWGRTLAKYAGAICEFVEQGNRLIPSVLSWNDVIVDPIDFSALPLIKKLYFTPAKLRKNDKYNQEFVEQLIESHQNRENLEGQDVDARDQFIEVYEVKGEMPVALLSDDPDKAPEEDWKKYKDQLHVVSFIRNKDGKYDDYTLYKGKLSKTPQMMTALIEEDGRTLPIGAVESLFDAQWMVNHTMKQTRDYLDLASKMIFQTSDTNFVGRNVLTAIETGQIMVHKENMPLTQINNSALNIQALLSYKQQWQMLGQEITATPDATRGITPPSGTPYSTVATLVQQSGSLFEIMTENKGLAIEDMLRNYVIPHLKKQMDTSDEIAAILDDQDITQLDAMYVPREAVKRYNKRAFEELLQEGIPSPYQKDIEEMQVKQELSVLGNQRFLKPSDISTSTWEKLLKDFEWNVHVEVTTEFEDKKILLQTLSTMLQTVAGNPMILQNPAAKQIFNRILTIAGGVSPIELSVAQTSSRMPPATSPLSAPSNGGVPTPLSVGN